MMGKYKNLYLLLLTLTFSLTAYALYLVFAVVPNERVMGPVQRIFYFHVGSAFACYMASAVVLISAIAYLITRDQKFDLALEAAGEVGFLFCSIVLSTGMIWGYSAWNTVFRLEPRLVTTLLMWMIFLGFIVLRHFGEPSKVAAQSAVLGILGALSVPLVIFSVKILPAFQQLHPQVVNTGGLKDPSFYQAMGYASAGLICLQFVLIWMRVSIGKFVRGVNG